MPRWEGNFFPGTHGRGLTRCSIQRGFGYIEIGGLKVGVVFIGVRAILLETFGDSTKSYGFQGTMGVVDFSVG